jgi:hypothetical protein
MIEKIYKKCNSCGKDYTWGKIGKEQWGNSKYCSRLCRFNNSKLSDNSRWRGGEFDRGDGYVIVRIGSFPRDYKGKRYELKHRLVMEEHIGRKLLRHEMVHHKNENKSDNRIENLELCTQSEHAKEHHSKRIRNEKGQYV